MTSPVESEVSRSTYGARQYRGITMRPSRPLATAVLLAGIALAGCTAAGTPTTSAAPAATAPPGGATAAPTTAAPATTSKPAATGTATASTCAETRNWGTGAKQSAPGSGAPLYAIRVGQHACYDRVVFDVNAPDAVGYHVQYVSMVRDDGSGTPRPVAGGAALEVIIHAPPQGLDNQGHQPGKILARPGQVFYGPAQLAGWRTLREIRYANYFEGQTTIAVGVRNQVPFRVFTLLNARDQVMRVVLDIAR